MATVVIFIVTITFYLEILPLSISNRNKIQEINLHLFQEDKQILVKNFHYAKIKLVHLPQKNFQHTAVKKFHNHIYFFVEDTELSKKAIYPMHKVYQDSYFPTVFLKSCNKGRVLANVYTIS